MRGMRVGLKALAVVNLIFVSWGFLALIQVIHHSKVLPSAWVETFPYTKAILNSMIVVSALLLLFLARGSIQLLRFQTGMGMCLAVFGLELMIWFGNALVARIALWTHSDRLVALASSVNANRSLGLFAIYPQIAILYPAVAGLVLLLSIAPMRSALSTKGP